MSSHPISDNAEVCVDFPDKLISAALGGIPQFDAYADQHSIAIRLLRPGEDRCEAVMHLHYGLLTRDPCRACQVVGRLRSA
jgi:hypothetical protein